MEHILGTDGGSALGVQKNCSDGKNGDNREGSAQQSHKAASRTCAKGVTGCRLFTSHVPSWTSVRHLRHAWITARRDPGTSSAFQQNPTPEKKEKTKGRHGKDGTNVQNQGACSVFQANNVKVLVRAALRCETRVRGLRVDRWLPGRCVFVAK